MKLLPKGLRFTVYAYEAVNCYLGSRMCCVARIEILRLTAPKVLPCIPATVTSEFKDALGQIGRIRNLNAT